MAAIFDWTDNSQYTNYFQQLGNILLHNTVKAQSIPIDTHIQQLKTFAFNLYDVNCDNFVDETDMFCFIKNVKSERFFQKVLQYDMNDIVKHLQATNKRIKDQDPIIDYKRDGSMKIRDLNGFISRSIKKSAEQKKAQEVYNLYNVKTA